MGYISGMRSSYTEEKFAMHGIPGAKPVFSIRCAPLPTIYEVRRQSIRDASSCNVAIHDLQKYINLKSPISRSTSCCLSNASRQIEHCSVFSLPAGLVDLTTN